jgi:hypothetical protein
MLRTTLKTAWKPPEYPKEFRHLGDHIRAKRLDVGLQIKQLAKQLTAEESRKAANQSIAQLSESVPVFRNLQCEEAIAHFEIGLNDSPLVLG